MRKYNSMMTVRRRVVLAIALPLMAALPVLKLAGYFDNDAADEASDVRIVRGPEPGAMALAAPRNDRGMSSAIEPRAALLMATRWVYPALRNVSVTCDGAHCVIEISSRGLVEAGERDAIFGVVTGGLEEGLKKQGYAVGERSTAVYGDGTTVVTIEATAGRAN